MALKILPLRNEPDANPLDSVYSRKRAVNMIEVMRSQQRVWFGSFLNGEFTDGGEEISTPEKLY